MKIFLRQEKGCRGYEITDIEARTWALSLKVENYDNLDENDKKKKLQKAVNQRFNYEYHNNVRKQNKHKGYINDPKKFDDEETTDLMDTRPMDYNPIDKLLDAMTFEYYIKEIKQILKKDTLFNVFEAVARDGKKVDEYANEVNVDRTTMEHRLERARKVLQANKEFIAELISYSRKPHKKLDNLCTNKASECH